MSIKLSKNPECALYIGWKRVVHEWARMGTNEPNKRGNECLP
jgi:hypothetical protein